MAYNNYNYNSQIPVQVQNGQYPMPQQNIQPLFPQPQGNVYNINSTLEVANVPVGAGMSVALCMPENLMYIKTMQNGNPLFYPYKIIPFNQEGAGAQEKTEATQTDFVESLAAQLKKCNERIEDLEKQLSKLKPKKSEGGWEV